MPLQPTNNQANGSDQAGSRGEKAEELGTGKLVDRLHLVAQDLVIDRRRGSRHNIDRNSCRGPIWFVLPASLLYMTRGTEAGWNLIWHYWRIAHAVRNS